MMLRTIAVLSLIGAARTASAETLTADKAVELALKRSTAAINADLGVLDARSGLYGAYSGVLPSISAGLTRSGSLSTHNTGSQLFGAFAIPSDPYDSESYSTTPQISGRWNVLDLSGLSSLSSARQGLKAAQFRRTASRQDIALSARRQFYEVVMAVRLADVSVRALQLSRSDERRVRALFEVGSVSRSDLLKAQVRTAQSQLDSLTAIDNITVQRITLGNLLGVAERDLGDVDTALSVQTQSYDPAAVLAEAAKNRPDLKAAELEFKSASSGLRAANLARLPYITFSGSAAYNPFRTSRSSVDSAGLGTNIQTTSVRNESDRQLSGSVAINWDIFSGMSTESRIASAQARLERARDTRAVALRNLEGEVHEALLAHEEALERNRLGESAYESAAENLKLTQQKYNVGSATILELIDAQVQLQRAESDQVTALAALRVAEAQLDRVRGR
jgi:outer membrane protein TolC